ncbi:MAG: D-aminoacyl-tRNA deacylase [Anaerorhabdus sp.]
MRVVVQRVKEASVKIDNKIHSSIGEGLLLLVGIRVDDSVETVRKMAKKILNLRIFTDENDKMNLSLIDKGYKVLSVSQFTLSADLKKGNRPSFTEAEKPERAKLLYELFNEALEEEVSVSKGVFQAHMEVSLVNDGPVTIIMDSRDMKL